MNPANSDMLLETLIARTIGEESVLAMSVLLAAPVPAGVLRYMRAEIFNRLAEDLSHAPHFARVAPPSAGPDAIRDALLTHAAGQYIFPREEFLGMLENAARFTENYLCRPRWTLSSFLFLDQSAITTEMLLRKLEYISDYAYLPQLLRRIVTHSGKQVITSHECIAHITRIDDAVIREHTPRERALLTKPIFQFFLLSSDIENKPIALRALLLFLEDKQFGPLREYSEGVWQIRGKSEITMAEFVALNEDFAIGRSSFAPTPTIAEPPPEPTPEPPDPEILPPATEPAESALPETPSPEAAAINAPPPEIPPLPEVPPPPEIPPPPAETIQGSLSFMEFLPAEPEIPVAPSSLSLKETIPGTLRRRFINVICGKDEEFYDLVIARLDDMHSWPEASTYIRELFEINSIDPFNDTAIAFTDIIQKRCDHSRMAQQ